MKTELKDPGFTQTLSFKLIIIGFLSLVLLIPTAWIRNIISEREKRNDEVSKEISSVWSDKQIMAGPVLSIPYRTSFTREGKIHIKKSGTAHFLP